MIAENLSSKGNIGREVCSQDMRTSLMTPLLGKSYFQERLAMITWTRSDYFKHQQTLLGVHS